jgi:hypothetical protein
VKRTLPLGNAFLTKPPEGGPGDQSFVGKTGQNRPDHEQRPVPDAETSRASETVSKIGFAALWAMATAAVVFLAHPADQPAGAADRGIDGRLDHADPEAGAP